MINRVVGLYFSPRGGTAKITEQIAKEVAAELQDRCTGGQEIACLCYDIDRVPATELDLDENSVVVIGMPVRVGKLSLPALAKLREISGSGAMAIELVSYGTMSYGNALYELHYHAEDMGFKVVGAGAFVVKHRGPGDRNLVRPDLNDLNEIRDFSAAISNKLARLSGCEIDALRIKPTPLLIAGRMPIHRISKLSPDAAVIAERTFEKVTVFRKNPEWYL